MTVGLLSDNKPYSHRLHYGAVLFVRFVFGITAMNRSFHRIEHMTTTIESTIENLKERIETRQARVGIVGMGYVGLPLALLFSDERFR